MTIRTAAFLDATAWRSAGARAGTVPSLGRSDDVWRITLTSHPSASKRSNYDMQRYDTARNSLLPTNDRWSPPSDADIYTSTSRSISISSRAVVPDYAHPSRVDDRTFPCTPRL